MTTELMTADEAKAAVLAVLEAHPRRKNPYDPGIEQCLYTDPKDPERHCVIGQLAADRGWLLPWSAGSAARTAAIECGWPVDGGARHRLGEAQDIADGAFSDGPRPTWGQAAKKLREKWAQS